MLLEPLYMHDMDLLLQNALSQYSQSPAAAQSVFDLAKQTGKLRHLNANETLIRQGEEQHTCWLILRGHCQITMQDYFLNQTIHLKTVGFGEFLGEKTLFQTGPRSATVTTCNEVDVLEFDKNELLATHQLSALKELLLIIGRNQINRLETANRTVMSEYHQRLEESQKRIMAISMFIAVASVYCLLTYFITLKDTIKHYLTLPQYLFSAAFIAYLLIIAVSYVLRHKNRLDYDYGFNLKNWKTVLAETCLFSLPWLVLLIVVKMALLNYVYTGRYYPVLIFTEKLAQYQQHPEALTTLLYRLLAYITFIPAQEFIARGGMQGLLKKFLTGPRRALLAIFMSNAIFASVHLITFSAFDSMLVFLPGLFWGWLFERHQSLLSPVLSHIIIGCFGFFIVGWGVIPL